MDSEGYRLMLFFLQFILQLYVVNVIQFLKTNIRQYEFPSI